MKHVFEIVIKLNYSFFVAFALILGTSCKPDKEKIFVVGFSQCISTDAWRQAMHEEMLRELSFYPNIELIIKDAAGNNELQIAQIKEFQELGIDLLIVSPNESDPITPIVSEVFQSGVPVIVVDRKINSNQYTAYVGGNNFEIGYSVGQYIKNLIPDKLEILEIWGLKGSSPAKDRHQGLVSSLGGEESIKYRIDGEWERKVAKDKLRVFLKENPNASFNLIFGHNDVMAISASEVCKELGYEHIKVIGVDALPGPLAGIQAVSDGVLHTTFFYPTGGEKAIELAWKILSKDSFEKENILQTAAVDSSNVRIMKQQTDRIINQQTNIVRQQDMIRSQIDIYQSQKGLLIVFAVTLFIALISLAYVFKSLKDKQEINRELEAKNSEILKQQQQLLDYSKKAEEATTQKLEFFTNVSHEFRTPLTLILAPLEEMLNSPNVSLFKKDLILIRKNAHRLLRLVNQIMDFRKLDNGKMKIQVTEQEIVPFIEEIMSVFEKKADSMKVRLKLFCEEPKLKLWFDPSVMDKVFFNLLSNSFKFVSEKGFVSIRVFQDILKYEVVIQVEDNGTGIDQEEISYVFDRFYQGRTGVRKVGTGLGLALAKELVELQYGQINVRSNLGETTVFEIRMKMGQTHFQESEIAKDFTQNAHADFDNFTTEEELPTLQGNEYASQSVLIIEDDAEIRDYIKRGLAANYQIMEASDTSSGFSKACDFIPDLITCDLMLGSGNGFDLISQLKGNPITASIPIIILSAKSSSEEQLKGIKLGVEDYVVKPFNMAILKEKIKTILQNRNKIEQFYLHGLPVAEHKADKIDKKFIIEFKSIIEKNLHDPDFGVNAICRELGLSRGQLYRKVKSELGYSVNDYITKVRLKKSKYLLGESDKSIADISFLTGFKSAAYFSTVFKNSLGITPSEFRDQQSG
ncbi:hybrid sensor histidine kinase/response regulator transcription factor [Fontibacter flavus]|uniref:histidine kinase n=1 Tax=Fontibacter flavus TaxID=654838 RepID=A0ABV6FP76_9BACT